MGAPQVLVLVSDGFEDMEAAAPIDVLTRCGMQVTIASLVPGTVKGAWGGNLTPDTVVSACTGVFDAVILPGGAANARHLAQSPEVIDLVQRQVSSERLMAALCASPGCVLAEAAGVLAGRRATGAPGFTAQLAAGGARVTDEDVTVDGRIVTGRGPGAAIEFALTVASMLGASAKVRDLAERWRIEWRPPGD